MKKPDKPVSAAELLAHNLRLMMKKHGYSKAELERRSGVSDRHIAYILTMERVASIDVVESIAKAFGLQAWQLIHEKLTDDSAVNHKVEQVISDYMNASDDGRKLIFMVAEREAKYGQKDDG